MKTIKQRSRVRIYYADGKWRWFWNVSDYEYIHRVRFDPDRIPISDMTQKFCDELNSRARLRKQNSIQEQIKNKTDYPSVKSQGRFLRAVTGWRTK